MYWLGCEYRLGGRQLQIRNGHQVATLFDSPDYEDVIKSIEMSDSPLVSCSLRLFNLIDHCISNRTFFSAIWPQASSCSKNVLNGQ